MRRVFFSFAITFFCSIFFLKVAEAKPYYYPQLRYVGSANEAMGGVVVPFTEEVGNSLMNNPAGLARFSGYRSEPMNLNFIINGNSLSNFSSTMFKSFSLGGISGTMNGKPATPFGLGFTNMTAFAWNGIALGFLLQEHSRAISDGTNATYQVVSQFIPAFGYAFGMARNVIRVGYSLQYVNETSGQVTAASNSNASFLNGLNKGGGLSHNVSINLALPFTYLPTFSILARNLGGLHYSRTSLLPRGTNIAGVPPSQQMSIDLGFDFQVRISGTLKSHWFFEYKDANKHSSIPTTMERLSTGLDLNLSPAVALKAGMTGIAQFSVGGSYRSEQSEIGLNYYQERSPFNSGPAWETRFALQYKLLLNQKARKEEGSLQQVGSVR
jgi:hypothetical protein